MSYMRQLGAVNSYREGISFRLHLKALDKLLALAIKEHSTFVKTITIWRYELYVPSHGEFVHEVTLRHLCVGWTW